MEEVLYHPTFGYYAASSRIGMEGGDFYTASDLDPIFGKLLADYFSRLSEEIEDFTVVELGAGKGLLARDILSTCRFRYLILERSEAMRARQHSALAGFDVEWIDELPQRVTGCIFSNEFFDALPVHRFVGRAGQVKEIFVGPDFTEIEQEPSDTVRLHLNEGQIADINLEALSWMRKVAQSLTRGYHITIDYGYLRDEFFAQPRGTLMCYRQHQAHENPYINIGEQDMTSHVNFSDLIDEGTSAGLELVSYSKQREFLIELGILTEMQRLAESGTAASFERLVRIKNLVLPDRMGDRFKVLVQRRARMLDDNPGISIESPPTSIGGRS
jgi:SAM-dependent MidA family methyltransferase